MGNRLFGVDIAGEVNKAMGAGLLPVTVTKRTPGSRTSGSLTAGTNPTTTVLRGRGFAEDYQDAQVDGTQIQRGDRKVLILGASLKPAGVPEPGDKVTVEGETGYIVEDGVKRDPAAAAYVCQVRTK